MIGNRGFSALELVVVMSIMVILASITVPAVLSSMRRSAVRQAAGAIVSMWQQARTLAVGNQPYFQAAGDQGKFFGVSITTTGATSKVSLVFDSAASGAAAWQSGVNEVTFNRNIAVATGIGGAAAAVTANEVLWYAQYGTGYPLRPADVGGVMPNERSGIGVGIPSSGGIPSLLTDLQVRTLDFDATRKTGMAVRIRIYPIGVAVTEDVQP